MIEANLRNQEPQAPTNLALIDRTDHSNESKGTESAGSNILEITGRTSTREASLRKKVDETTKQLHYSMQAVQTAITLARRNWDLPSLE